MNHIINIYFLCIYNLGQSNYDSSIRELVLGYMNGIQALYLLPSLRCPSTLPYVPVGAIVANTLCNSPLPSHPKSNRNSHFYVRS